MTIILICGGNRKVRNKIATTMASKLSTFDEMFAIHEMEQTVSKRYRQLWQELGSDVMAEDDGSLQMYRDSMSNKRDDIWARLAEKDLADIYSSGHRNVIVTGLKNRGEYSYFNKNYPNYSILIINVTGDLVEDFPFNETDETFDVVVKLHDHDDLDEIIDTLVAGYYGFTESVSEDNDGPSYKNDKNRWDIRDVA